MRILCYSKINKTLSIQIHVHDMYAENALKKQIKMLMLLFYALCLIPLFHTGPESHELTRIEKYLDSWLYRTQFVKILTDSHSP